MNHSNETSMESRADPFCPVLPERPDGVRYWSRLYAGARSLAIWQAALQAKQPLVVLTRDLKAMENMLVELMFYRSQSEDIPILSFPDWETLPYDIFSPYQDIISERLDTLTRMPTLQQGIVVVPVSTAMHRLLPRSWLKGSSLRLSAGDALDIGHFRRELDEGGYRYVPQVFEHGDFSVRGSILDLFPMGSKQPFRLDLLDDRIDSIRVFDPETQRSAGTVDRIDILPASEICLSDEAISRFRAAWRSHFAGNPANVTLYNDVSRRQSPAGIEYYLPLFYESTSTLFDYLETGFCVMLDEGALEAVEHFYQEVGSRYQQLNGNPLRPLLPPEQLYLTPAEFHERIRTRQHVHVSGLELTDKIRVDRYGTRVPLQLPVDIRSPEPLRALQRFLDDFSGRVLIVAESPGRRETMLDLFRGQDIVPVLCNDWREFLESDAELALTVAPMEQGLVIETARIAVITETQLYGERVQQKRLRKRRQADSQAVVRNLAELRIGAPVVHEHNGVGRYQGLVTLTVGGIANEFICLEYDRGDKLYVPVTSLDLISRYTGVDPEHAPLHRLGSGQWQKARSKAEKRIHDVAAELLELHARRAARQGDSFSLEDDAYRAFIQGFPFEETPDQQDAIDAVIADMRAARPMDRLVCGDAGFGKTEVAMRAAFMCVNNQRQVAILVPTTLLAQQHFQNFRDRFADWPVRIESLSRFTGRREQEQVVADLAAGKVDIVIGTHRLLQDDIRFRNLGLLIIDEEHRFGVRQKERFKALRAEVDVLTLTATPIPRTLNMAIADLRDLSIIATPPSRRLAVKTFVQEWRDEIVAEAIQREIRRGGQVYFLHNDVETIEKTAEMLQRLVPDARVIHAHGQMPERQLEQVMLDFYHRRHNILVCTTIIETGIDIPTANTIIINRADRFGLAQLYQLRGRVGRSHHRAYAYLLIPSLQSISRDAIKRLEAIESLEELGVGFTLAIHDLEIRGAGEILGEEQSGQIQEIGFSLYMELLERAVGAMKAGRQPRLDRPLDHGIEIDLHTAALIPEDYLPDVHTRLILYKRIASANDADELEALQEEMIDRFGLLPEPVKTLFAIAGYKRALSGRGIRKIDMNNAGGRIQFEPDAVTDAAALIRLIQSQPGTYRLDGPEKLRIMSELPDAGARMAFLSKFIDSITANEAT